MKVRELIEYLKKQFANILGWEIGKVIVKRFDSIKPSPEAKNRNIRYFTAGFFITCGVFLAMMFIGLVVANFLYEDAPKSLDGQGVGMTVYDDHTVIVMSINDCHMISTGSNLTMAFNCGITPIPYYCGGGCK